MNTQRISLLFSLMFLSGCSSEPGKNKTDQWKQEILNTEKAFSDLSQREGIAEAFLTYAAEDAVLMRNNQLVQGRDAIARRFEENKPDPGEVTLTWVPDFVEVSAAGDLGYTYGSFTLITTDSLGSKSSSTGVFHTVWKRQKDGSWRFVWD